MNAMCGVRYKYVLSYGKIVKKRLAVNLSQAHELLSRSAGYRDFHHLQSSAIDPDTDCRVLMTVDRWTARLRAEVGSDFDDLFPSEEIDIWFRRMYVPFSDTNH